MPVALGAGKSTAHHSFPGGIDPIYDRSHSKFLIISPSFIISDGVAMKARCGILSIGGIRQQISS